jgi:hypothetical protein
MRNNGLSIVLAAFFLICLVLQCVTGWKTYNDEQRDHGRSEVELATYLTTGHFLESVAENWESEFLQMAAYVFLTAFLFQKGSSESKKPDEPNPEDEDPRKHRKAPDAPWPVRRGGAVLRLYEYSLGTALLLLFVVSFAMHAGYGYRHYVEEELEHGGPAPALQEYLASSRFWFESMQNWQSEFLAVLAIVLLSIFLRHRGSPESKPVAAPHSETGH